MKDRAGWGFLILTDICCPIRATATFRIYAYAEDASGGRATLLGAKTIVVNNAAATLPFGAIDTPGRGEAIAGSAYLNWGWALTPQPRIIPTDGSTIQVSAWTACRKGNPTYNLFRPDVSGPVPRSGEFGRAGRGIGYSTQLRSPKASTRSRGLVSDSLGEANGIGSRYFSVANSADAQALALKSAGDFDRDAGDAGHRAGGARRRRLRSSPEPDRGRHAGSLTSAPAVEGPVFAVRGDEPARR